MASPTRPKNHFYTGRTDGMKHAIGQAWMAPIGELVQPTTRIREKECTMSTATGQPEGQTQEVEQPAEAQDRKPQEEQQSPGQQPEGQMQEGQQPEGKTQPNGHQ